MSKKVLLRLELLIILIGALFLLAVADRIDNYTKDLRSKNFDNWNNGYCEDCNVRLDYESCGNRYFYRCPKCDRVYSFDKAQSYCK